MKLSPRLIHLSQEHDAALQLAVAVRSLSTDDDSALPAVAQQIRESFERLFLPHFADEEHYVVPRLEAIGRQDLIDRMRAEHEHLSALATALAQPTEEAIRSFAATLTEHVSFEENIIWEVLEPGAGAPFEIDAV